MPSKSPNPPLPPTRTGILPFKGKYFCCNNLPLHALEIVKGHLDKDFNTRDGTAPPSGPITGLFNDDITSAQILIHFLEWAKLYYESTPPLTGAREMNINEITWFVKVKELKSLKERFFFPALGSTPITGITYSFLEAAVEDLTFPDKEIQKRLGEEFLCPYPKGKKWGTCVEHSAPHRLRKGRAFEISAWDRKEKAVVQERKNEVECVVPAAPSKSNMSVEANNEDSEDKEARTIDLKALKEMLVVSDKVEKERAAKEMRATKKGKSEGTGSGS